MKPASAQPTDLNLNIVGSNTFGRYPKISDEKTYNMLISDEALVPYAGYRLDKVIDTAGSGRAIKTSTRLNRLIVVIDQNVYDVSRIGQSLSYSLIGELDTFAGDVFVAENNNNQIAVCDKSSIWIYDYSGSPTWTKATEQAGDPLPFIPGYVEYQDGRFIAPALNDNIVSSVGARWYISNVGNGKLWSEDDFAGLQTKSDIPVATVRIPGKGNNLYVFGSTVGELWTDVGAEIFPYVRNENVNIDYGCLSANTIDVSDNYVAWLGFNEKSGPVILVAQGGEAQQISTDGINFLLGSLKNPAASYGFFVKFYGHLIYQLTFTDSRDDLTLLYDFNTQKFFFASDENMHYHIAKSVAYYLGRYYFVSLIDGNIYEMSPDLYTYDYSVDDEVREFEIPWVRICRNMRLKDQSRFVINNLTFTMEMGNDPNWQMTRLQAISAQNGVLIGDQDEGEIISQILIEPYEPRVDLSLSKDGGESYSNYGSKVLNKLGKRKNRINFWSLGSANDLVPQVRFHSKFRIVVFDGNVSIYQ